MKIACWNINGIRAVLKKDFLKWVSKFSPEIICLQETKVNPDTLPREVNPLKGYKSYFSFAQKKGYSGVAILVKEDTNLIKIENGIGVDKFDDEGRTLIAHFDNFILFCCYFPNGQRDHNRVPYKLEYSDEVANLAIKYKKKYKKEIIVCGDYNTAHHEIDLANPKTNTKTTGFLPIEREWMTKFENLGFTDAFRVFTPEENGHYTWWTYRNNCRERNIGWRIDYFFVTNKILKEVKKCYHLPKVLGSDHCPIVMEL